VADFHRCGGVGAFVSAVSCWSVGDSRNVEHIRSTHDDAELEALNAAARQLAAERARVDLAWVVQGAFGPLEITSSQEGLLCDALCRAYDASGLLRLSVMRRQADRPDLRWPPHPHRRRPLPPDLREAVTPIK
jgi:hypothetical protein